MATSQTLQEENAIVLASVNKFIELGQEASERIINGMTPEKQDEKAEQILQLLTAYRQKDRLSDDNLESLLNAMKMLSGENSLPSVDPIVGQAIIYRITESSSSSSGGVSTGETPYRGDYDPSGGSSPGAATGSGVAGAIRKGDEYYATDGTPGAGVGTPIGNVFGEDIYKGCLFKARVDGAGPSRNDWYLSQDAY